MPFSAAARRSLLLALLASSLSAGAPDLVAAGARHAAADTASPAAHRRAALKRAARRPAPPGRLREAAAGQGFFSPDSFWNTPVGASPALDPSSVALVARLGKEVAAEQGRRSGPWINTTQYSTPIYEVPTDQPTVGVKLDHAPDGALEGAFSRAPLPDNAIPAAGTDHHLVLSQPSTDRMWEFWHLQRKADGWHAGWGGAMEGVSRNRGVFDTDAWSGAKPWWGATATSLPLAGGLITLDDLRRGSIDHALALAAPITRAGVWAAPAQRGDGNSADPSSLPEGARLRIDPALDLVSLKLPPLTLMMAQAAQRYGIVVRDFAGVVTFVAQDPTPLPGVNPYTNNPAGSAPKPGGYFGGQYPSKLLARFPWGSLQVLKMDLRKRA